MKTDWKKLGLEVGSIKPNSYAESGGTMFAKKALDKILGDEWIRHTVDHALTLGPGAELAMNCLSHLSSSAAAKYAYSIYKSDFDPENRRLAVWLIKHLTVEESFQWVEEFLNDQTVIDWGVGVLDQLLWSSVIDYDFHKDQIDALFNLALENSKGELKENIDFIKGYIKVRDALG